MQIAFHSAPCNLMLKDTLHYAQWKLANMYSFKYSLWLGLSCWRSLRVSGPLVENFRHGVWLNELWNTDLSSLSLLVKNFVGRVRRSRIQAPGQIQQTHRQGHENITFWSSPPYQRNEEWKWLELSCINLALYSCNIGTWIVLLIQCDTCWLIGWDSSWCRPPFSSHYKLFGTQYCWYHTMGVIELAGCHVKFLFQATGWF